MASNSPFNTNMIAVLQRSEERRNAERTLVFGEVNGYANFVQ